MVERPFPPRERVRKRKRKTSIWPDWVYYLIALGLVLLTLPFYARIFSLI